MKRSTRGFSLVEAVIAMALILIISAAVLTMILSASRAQGREMAHHAASNRLADIITVYRASESEDEFKENLAFALDMAVDTLDLVSVPLAEGYTAKIDCGETMTITVTDPKDKQKEYTFTNPLWGVAP